MMPRLLPLSPSVLALFAAVAAPAQGAPQVGVTPRLQLSAPAPTAVAFGDLQVRVAIEGGVATTELRQTIHNRTGAQREADWLLPLPKGAIADKFTMTVGGQTLAGEVLDAGRARSTYEAIVRQRRDPGLLEYAGTGCLRARVFPIPAQGKVDVVVRFTQLLQRRGTARTWWFPIRGACVAQRFEGRMTLHASIHSAANLHNVYSPLSGIDIVRKGDHDAELSLELPAGEIPARDLEVHFGISDKAFGLDLLTWREGDEGFFMMMVDPKRDWGDTPKTRRSMSFVLDTSGSMAGQKMAQATGALRQFIASLDAAEYFNIVPFATTARPFFPTPVAANQENIAAALKMLEGLEARGGTNIDEAMRFALDQAWPAEEICGDRTAMLPITVFLTDGLPSVGESDIDRLTKGLLEANDDASRVFVFGVGDDVNTRLLDTLATENRGTGDYVRPDENIEVAASALFAKISGPVMTDLALTCDGIEGFDVFPRQAPDLFTGGLLVFVGRYKKPGHHAVRLRGKVHGTIREYVFEKTFPEAAADHAFVRTLWAQRKLAVLLEALQKTPNNGELLTEIRTLGAEYGVVTPLTSHLILEEADRIAMQRGLPQGQGTFGSVPTRELIDDLRRRGGGVDLGGIIPPAAMPAAPRAGSGFDTATGAQPASDPAAPDMETRIRAEAERARRTMTETAKTGAAAVDRSVALIRLADARHVDSGSRRGVTRLTQQHVGGRTFYLVGGVWVQKEFDRSLATSAERVEAFSPRWFELSRAHAALSPVLAFSTRIVVVLGDGDERRAIEIVPASTETR